MRTLQALTGMLALAGALTLTACGSAGQLTPAKGERLPIAPYGATATPTPQDLLTPSAQARPSRSDEVLTNSSQRRSDEFDLPPR